MVTVDSYYLTLTISYNSDFRKQQGEFASRQLKWPQVNSLLDVNLMNRVTQAVRPTWVSLAFHLNISLKTPLKINLVLFAYYLYI